MSPAISVIICTHNPRPEYLRRVFETLRNQTLPQAEWELLLIDNASDPPLAANFDLTWHPQARHVREEALGLTKARLRGLRESRADLLVFFDDDNLPDPDYLQQALAIAGDWPRIGVWGGQIIPEFETPPPAWTRPFWGSLALREASRDQWSNLLHQYETTPSGAGMCVRRSVIEHYADYVANDPSRRALDRTGSDLLSGGDTDLAFTACDMGMGTGVFVALKMKHIIPAQRLEEDYLIRLMNRMAYSGVWLDHFRGKHPQPEPPAWRRWLSMLRKNSRDRRFAGAVYQGRQKAIREIEAGHSVKSQTK